MPLLHSAQTLRKTCLFCLAKNWDLICYSVQSHAEMAELLETDAYLGFKGPFSDFPSPILEDLMDVIRVVRSLSRKFMHLLMGERLLKLNLSLGVGEIYYGLEFLPRCKKLRDLNLSYLRHIEPSHFIPILQHLPNLTSLNLAMSCAHDPLLKKISEYCPNIVELNLQSTYISDDGLLSLCGIGESCGVVGKPGCLKLRRLIISDTRITWISAQQLFLSLKLLVDFDFDKIFQVFEHLDPESLQKLSLSALYSITPSIRGESIDTAAKLCPDAHILSISNCWIDDETFYKFMQFEHLKSLTIFNSEGKTLSYGEGVLPLLQIVGPCLENLILSKFSTVELHSLGMSCPNLKKIALSAINNIEAGGDEQNIFKRLVNVELWMENDEDFNSSLVLQVLLNNSLGLENLLVKRSNALDTQLLWKIWSRNPMPNLSRLLLDECRNIGKDSILELLSMKNELSTLRIWSCPNITNEHRLELKQFIDKFHLQLYLEWFE